MRETIREYTTTLNLFACTTMHKLQLSRETNVVGWHKGPETLALQGLRLLVVESVRGRERERPGAELRCVWSGVSSC